MLACLTRLAFAFLLGSSPSLADAVRVTSFEGKVKYWPQWGDSWIELGVNGEIPLGSMVLVGTNSHLSYIPSDQSLGFGEIKINRPLAFRLDGSEVRKISVPPSFVTELPDIEGLNLPQEPPSEEKNVASSIVNAWNKIIIMSAKPFKAGQEARPSQGSSSSSAAKGIVDSAVISAKAGAENPLKIIYPKETNVAVTQLPYQVNLLWKTEQKGAPRGRIHEIWLKKGNEAPVLIDRTPQRSYALSLNEYADYTIEIKLKSALDTSLAILTRNLKTINHKGHRRQLTNINLLRGYIHNHDGPRVVAL